MADHDVMKDQEILEKISTTGLRSLVHYHMRKARHWKGIAVSATIFGLVGFIVGTIGTFL